MSRSYFMTPEEKMRMKKRKKFYLYGTLIVLTAILSTALTFLANQI